MTDNTGTAPRTDRVDLRFANGSVVRNTEPRLWRWTRDDPRFPPAWDYDIASWRKAA